LGRVRRLLHWIRFRSCFTSCLFFRHERRIIHLHISFRKLLPGSVYWTFFTTVQWHCTPASHPAWQSKSSRVWDLESGHSSVMAFWDRVWCMICFHCILDRVGIGRHFWECILSVQQGL
jgi:hypothetical protein